mgnify:CR=1 FL=1
MASLTFAFRAVSALETGEGATAGVDGVVGQLVLDKQQLVVLVDALATGGSTGLDLTRVGGHREIGDGGVLGLTGTVGGHGLEARTVRTLHGLERLGQRTDLVHLDEQGVGRLLINAALETLGVGHEEVVTDDLKL